MNRGPRKNIRLSGYDYSRVGAYFVTIRTLPIKDKTENNILLCSYPKFFPL